MTADPATLAETIGPGRASASLYVTDRAASAYGEVTRQRDAEARRSLTEYLLDATRTGDPSEYPERWRRRSRTDAIDVTARVAREGRLAVVVAASVRSYR